MMEMDSLEVVNLWSSRHSTDRSLVAPILHEFGEHSIGFKYFSVNILGVVLIIHSIYMC
jgi:hypothetical protein